MENLVLGCWGLGLGLGASGGWGLGAGEPWFWVGFWGWGWGWEFWGVLRLEIALNLAGLGFATGT